MIQLHKKTFLLYSDHAIVMIFFFLLVKIMKRNRQKKKERSFNCVFSELPINNYRRILGDQNLNVMNVSCNDIYIRLSVSIAAGWLVPRGDNSDNYGLLVFVDVHHGPLCSTALAGLFPPSDSLDRCWWDSARHSTSEKRVLRAMAGWLGSCVMFR